MAKVPKMNQKGFALPAIFGLAYILAAIIVLVLLWAVWTFWKPLFVFAIGVAVLYFALAVIPQMVKGKQGLKFVAIASGIGALLIIASLLPLPFYSIFQPGNEAPLTGEIILGIKERELTEGTPVKILEGETLTMQFDGELWNRSYSIPGNALVAGNWYIDRQHVEMMPGQTQTIFDEYTVGLDPNFGPIATEQWHWDTIPYIAQMGAQGSIVSISNQTEAQLVGFSPGTHQVSVQASVLADASTRQDVFASGGACYPLQTQSQGFPCSGIYGQTIARNRQATTRCPLRSIPEINPSYQFFECPSEIGSGCGSWCCITDYASFHIFNWAGKQYATCDDRPYPAYGDWINSLKVQRLYEEAFLSSSAGETVAVAEFEVVASCPNECCVGLEGYQDKFCSGGDVCTGGTCILPIEACPFECCEEQPQYQNKECGEGEYCVSNACIYEPEPPLKPFWENVIASILSWLQGIFSLFFSITGETVVTPGETYEYQISVATTMPDTDYSDGLASFQYANWALVDSAGNIVEQGEWEQVEGSYSKQVTLTVPQNVNNHVLIAVIQQTDQAYNFTSKQWETVSETVVAREGINLSTALPAPDPSPPPLTALFEIIQGFWSWLLALFGL